MAVAFVIGVAFAAVVTALVTDLITPLIALITFTVIAAVVFFFVVKPVNHLMDRMKTEPPVDDTVKQCEHCLSSILVAASVCSFCTRNIAPA